ncbi:phospholipid-translocating ATPase [Aureococcus anophagefferens]|nr:phospholipid-translocating ATPase [Aureococcus anophagefferens]
MKSNKDPPMKESSLILAINRVLKYIIGLLTMICLTGGLCSYLWMSSNAGEDAWYLGYPRADAIWGAADRRASQARVVNLEEAWFIKFFYYFLLMAQFVPVSLYVSMSMTKNFQARFLEWDLGMYHEASDTPCAVKSMALNEELGQISHVFSDKTGTLTCNVMDFRKCAVGGRSYGEGITAIGAASLARLGEPIPAAALEANELARASSQPHVTFHDPRLAEDLAAPGPQRDRLVEFFRLLAVCHTVLVEDVGDEADAPPAKAARGRSPPPPAPTESARKRTFLDRLSPGLGRRLSRSLEPPAPRRSRALGPRKTLLRRRPTTRRSPAAPSTSASPSSRGRRAS